MNNQTYTQEEINKALFELNKRLDNKKLERTEINAEMRSIKENIEYYENLDKRQLKISYE